MRILKQATILAAWLLFAPQIAAIAVVADGEAPFLENVRQLTYEGRRSGEGYFSADGRHFVFQSEREPGNPFFQIYRLDLETGDVERISPGVGKTTCAWIHPDGRRVLFASTHLDPEAEDKQRAELEAREEGRQRRYSWDYDEHFDLFVKDLSDGTLERLTDALGYNAEGAYSPDGEWIVFSSNREAYQRPLTPEERERFEVDKAYFADLYLMRSDGTELRRLTSAPGYDGGPFFSPDGNEIVWRRFSEDGTQSEIFTLKLKAGKERRLTRLDALSWAPFYHPSGRYVIFSTNLHGMSNFELYLVDRQGSSEPVRVTFSENFDGLPSFSPDGRKLAWTSNRTAGGNSQIFLADWNHQAALKALGLEPVSDRSTQITSTELERHVRLLASEEMEGRLTGSQGERRAAEYIERVLAESGLEPFDPEQGYRLPFEFTSGVALGNANRLVLHAGDAVWEAEVDRDWRPLAFSETGRREPASVVFAGYGIAAPAVDGQELYDSYAHLDVEGKWALILRFLPEDVAPEKRQHLARFASLRYKALAARERGATGIIVVSGPRSGVRNELIELALDSSLGGTSLGAISISDSVAQRLLADSAKDLEELQEELDSGRPQMGFELGGVRVETTIDVVRQKGVAYNVAARLAGSHSDLPAVFIGAHYDHLGRGEAGTSLARDREGQAVHYGADDNASGVAAVLEIARFLAAGSRQGEVLLRDVVFGFWSGEEIGLLGSSHFASDNLARGNARDLSGQALAYLNLDMVGRLRDSLVVQGIGSSSVWPGEIERRNVPIGLPLTLQQEAYLPTDATSFYLQKVPVLSFFTGAHEEYHTPEDTADTVNYEGLERIARLAALLSRSLANRSDELDYQEMQRPERLGQRAMLRAFLGTIPDYAQGDVLGLRLSGVMQNGPAQKAGIRAGDVIVELAGRKIENIYDYTFGIEGLKIGEAVRIVVMRDGETLEFELVPESRQ